AYTAGVLIHIWFVFRDCSRLRNVEYEDNQTTAYKPGRRTKYGMPAEGYLLRQRRSFTIKKNGLGFVWCNEMEVTFRQNGPKIYQCTYGPEVSGFVLGAR
ncbi:hypothetical protein L9F63_023474, partial [Diploptera punctata]